MKRVLTVLLISVIVFNSCTTDSGKINIDSSENTPSNNNVPIVSDAYSFWLEFISSAGYANYTQGQDASVLEYVIYDLNSDNTPELLIQSTDDTPFYYTWVFTTDGSNAILSIDTYGYGSYRYSAKHNTVNISSEFRPFEGNAVNLFYNFNGTKLEYAFTVGQDEGNYYFSDDNGSKSITADELSSYVNDLVNFNWEPITNLKIQSK